jgi:hypothetical protein
MSVFNKIKWISGVLLVFFIILATNIIDKDNFNRMRNSIVTIYEDRVVASDLIFEMGLLVQQKEIALLSQDTLFFKEENERVNGEIQHLIAKYEETKLTKEEKRIFEDLKIQLEKLEKEENADGSLALHANEKIFSTINEVVRNLHDLSKVQLKEGRREMARSNRAMETIDLFTQIEIIILVLIAVLIQVLILYNPKPK